MNRKFVRLALTLAVLASTAFHGAHAQSKPPLTAATGVDIVTIDPTKVTSGNDYLFFSNVFESLYGHDETGKLVPTLAESHTVSADGLVYAFKLRKNVKFHNGDPFTSEDVRFSWQHSVDPASRNPRANILADNIADVEIIDPHQVRLKLKKRDASMLENMDTYWLIVPKDHHAKVGREAYARQPVGTGPFMFVERKVKEYIKLKGFDGHWGRVPKIGDVTIKIVPDDLARIAQIQTGEADLVINVPPAIAAPLRRDPNVKIIAVPSYNNLFVSINSRANNPDLAKKEVRQALNMAVNKNALSRSLLLTFSTPQELFCSPGVIGCEGQVNPYFYDPKKAKDMLIKAGFDFNRPLKLVGVAEGRYAASKQTVEGIAFDLAQIGVKTNLVIMEYGAWLGVVTPKKKDPTVDLVFIGTTDYNNDPSSRLTKFVLTDGTNSFYSDPEMDKMLLKMNEFPSDKERLAFLSSVFRKIHEDAAFMPLWAVQSIYAARGAINWKPTPAVSWPILWNLEKK
jgi:peptide/nickel transport system substrate-binding protein